MNSHDTYGHDYGDIILTRASEQLRYWHEYGELFRIGGDEFIVVVTNMSLSRLEELLSKWYENLSGLNKEYNKLFENNFSYGIGYKEKDSKKSFEDVLNEADKNMYQMKRKK